MSYITRFTPRLFVFDFTNIISKAFNRWGQFKPVKKLSNAFLVPSCAFLLNFQKKRKVYFPIYIAFFADLSI